MAWTKPWVYFKQDEGAGVAQSVEQLIRNQ